MKIIIGVITLVGIAASLWAAGTVTYVKEADTTVTKKENFPQGEREGRASQIKTNINIIVERIAFLQSQITELNALKSAYEAEQTAIDAVK